jgi:hypothetical protein
MRQDALCEQPTSRREDNITTHVGTMRRPGLSRPDCLAWLLSPQKPYASLRGRQGHVVCSLKGAPGSGAPFTPS